MKLINLGKCDKHLIYPLIGGISNFTVSLILVYYRDSVEINKHPFILGINAGFGMSLAIFPYIYFFKNSKIGKRGKIINNVKNYGKLIERNNSLLKCEKYIILFLCAFLDFLQKILVFIFHYNITNNTWVFNIIFLNVFTSMLTKNKLYKHQYLSSGIMILCGIGLNIIFLYQMKTKDIPILFLSMLIEIIYSLAIVLAKYGMDFKFCSPFEITFYEGIFALILNAIFLSISSNIPLNEEFKYNDLLKISEYKGKKYLDNFYTYFEHLNYTEILLFILTMCGRLLFNLFSHITIKHFTSSHIFLILIMGEISSLVWSERSTGEVFIIGFIFFVEFVMILVFCEIIELNFFGLDKNTRKNIEERAKLENYEDDYENDQKSDSVDIGNDLLLNFDSQSSVNGNDK